MFSLANILANIHKKVNGFEMKIIFIMASRGKFRQMAQKSFDENLFQSPPLVKNQQQVSHCFGLSENPRRKGEKTMKMYEFNV